MGRFSLAYLLLILLPFLAACNPEIEVYAPPIESYYIVGILDPAQDTQYVRMSRVFQSPGDAYIYADTAELSVRGWHVSLSGGGRQWEALEMEVPADSGLFGGRHFVYAFVTDSSAPLQPETRYDLTLRKPTDTTYQIRAFTTIPSEPILNAPSQPNFSAQNNSYFFPTWDFDQDTDIGFERGTGFAFEARVWLYYLENGLEKSIASRPTRLRQTPFRCQANTLFDKMCLEIPGRSVPNYFRSQLADAGGVIEFPDTTRLASQIALLSKVARVEVTACDSFLARYLIGSNPNVGNLNLLMDKKEYSNFPAGHHGIFGAIHNSSRWIFLGECTKFLAGLSASAPPNCN